MRLQIGLINDVQPILIAQLVESGIVRVMRRAYRIYIEALHQLDIFDHGGKRHSPSQVRMEFVAVDALEHDRPAVHAQISALQLHFSDTDPVGDGLSHFAPGVFQLQQKMVQVRRLGAPQLRVRNVKSGAERL